MRCVIRVSKWDGSGPSAIASCACWSCADWGSMADGGERERRIRVFASLYRLRWRDEGEEREKGREAKGGGE